MNLPLIAAKGRLSALSDTDVWAKLAGQQKVEWVQMQKKQSVEFKRSLNSLYSV